MAVVEPAPGLKYQVADKLKEGLDIWKEKNKLDWDFVILVTGIERSGKSTLAMQIAKYLDPKFDMDMICWKGSDFEHLLKTCPPNRAVMLDEAHLTFHATGSGSRAQHRIINLLTEIGYKNLFIIIVCPTFFDLKRYLVLHRARCVIKVYEKKMERGRFMYFNYSRKKELYLKGYKTQNWNAAKANFVGKFSNISVVDLEEYKKRKATVVESLQKNESQEKSREAKNDMWNLTLNPVVFLNENNWLKTGAMKALAGHFGYSDRFLQKRMAKFKETRPTVHV